MRYAPALVATAASAMYVVVVALQLGRPLMYDDANFALAMRAVAETTLPFGNQGWMSERGDFSQREQWALWHPPLYVYLGGLVARIGGWTPDVMRALGIAGGLATAALTFFLAHDLTHGPRAARRFAAIVAVLLLVSCPLFVQSTLILDIDFPILLPLTLLFLFLYVRLEDTRFAWLWLIPVFGLLLWAKLTNPVPLPGIILVWQVLRGRFGRAVLHAAGIGGLGALLFGITWIVIGRWLGFPMDMPFGVNLVQWQDSADVARRAYASPGAFIEGWQPTVLWLGPGLVTLGLAGVAVRGAQLANSWHIRQIDLVIGLAIVLVIGYVNKNAGWFPKYQVALAPPLACLAAPLIAHTAIQRPRLAAACGLLSLAATSVVTLGLVRDEWALARTWHIDSAAGAWLVGIVALSALTGLPWRAAAATASASLLGLTIGWSVALDALQARVAYQTHYWYGTTGTVATAAWVDAHLGPELTYFAAKEVAIRSRQGTRYVDQDNLSYYLSVGRGFDGTWAGEQVHALVLWQREPYLADLFSRGLAASTFRETARFGDYVVYEPLASQE